MIRVVLVDDQTLVRRGLATILDIEEDIEVVGEAQNGRRAVEVATELRPDVVLMDVRMPEMNGIEAAERIRSTLPDTYVVMLTTFQDDEYLLDSMRAGASGFLLKDAGASLIASAVREAKRGQLLLDPAMTRSLVEDRLRAGPATPVPDAAWAGRLEALSDREQDVLEALASGKSNAQIAAALFVSEGTVKTHVSNVLTKTESRSRLEAVVFAFESGFVASRRSA